MPLISEFGNCLNFFQCLPEFPFSRLSTLCLGVEQPRSLHSANTLLSRRQRVEVPATPEIFFVREREKLPGAFPHVGETVGGSRRPSVATGRRTPCGHRRPIEPPGFAKKTPRLSHHWNQVPEEKTPLNFIL